jgi:hypothetical protein
MRDKSSTVEKSESVKTELQYEPYSIWRREGGDGATAAINPLSYGLFCVAHHMAGGPVGTPIRGRHLSKGRLFW